MYNFQPIVSALHPLTPKASDKGMYVPCHIYTTSNPSAIPFKGAPIQTLVTSSFFFFNVSKAHSWV